MDRGVPGLRPGLVAVLCGLEEVKIMSAKLTKHPDHGGVLVQWLAPRTTDRGVPGLRPGRVTFQCGLEEVTFSHCLVLVKPRKLWTYD